MRPLERNPNVAVDPSEGQIRIITGSKDHMIV